MLPYGRVICRNSWGMDIIVEDDNILDEHMVNTIKFRGYYVGEKY